MKYDLPISPEMARDVYNMSTFDIEYSGEVRTLHRFITYLAVQSHWKALEMCDDVSKGGTDTKEFERGFVKGIHEVHKMLQKALETGRKLQFPEENSDRGPRIV
jgi:hypothetical protein